MMSWMKQPQQRQSRRRIAELLLVTVDFVELDGLKKMTWLGCYGRFISSKQCNAMQCFSASIDEEGGQTDANRGSYSGCGAPLILTGCRRSADFVFLALGLLAKILKIESIQHQSTTIIA